MNPLTLTVESWRGALLSGAVPSPGPAVVILAALLGLTFHLALAQMRSAAQRY